MNRRIRMILLLGIVIGCMLPCTMVVSITPAWMERRVRGMAATLPCPEGVELLLERFRNVSGSSCRAVAYYWVYGSHRSAEEMAITAYRHALLEAGWREEEVDESQYLPRFRGKTMGRFQKGKYRLSIRWVDVHEAVLWTGAYEQQAELEARAKMFKALLMMELYLTGPCVD